MSKREKYGSRFDADEALASILDNVSKFALWGGLAALVISVGFLLMTYSAFTGSQPPGSAEQALNNIALLQKLLLAGGVAAVIGTTYMFWGEETLGFFQLGASAALWFAPIYVPSIMGGSIGGVPDQVGANALATIQQGGTVMGLISLMVLVADIATRIRLRAREGSRADQLKYGKGQKEERDVQNVFMGKCWQLPFCRKFVRERCPIYHARRTCWRERVGCMCEEEVIRNAMENRPIPKDLVAAARYIPQNHKLSAEAKKERCRQCVIFNEHQKHKYKLALPIVVLGYIALYALLREPLLAGTRQMVSGIDRAFSNLTYQQEGGVAQKVTGGALPFHEILLICFLIVALAYTLKALEYAMFKLKV